MGQDINSLLTGFSNSLNQYLGMGIQGNLQAKADEVKANRELANAKTLKEYENDLSLKSNMSLEAWKAKVEDVKKRGQSVQLGQLIDDPEFGNLARMAPEALIDAKDLLDYREKMAKAGQEKQPKEFQFKAGNYYKLATAGEGYLTDLSKRMDLGKWAPLNRSEYYPEILRGKDWKQFMTARKQIAEAYLRPATGATINPTEYEATDKIFIPLPGDSEKVKAAKAANRLNLRNSLKAEAEGKTVDLSVFEPVTEENADQIAGGSSTGNTGGWSIRPVGK